MHSGQDTAPFGNVGRAACCGGMTETQAWARREVGMRREHALAMGSVMVMEQCTRCVHLSMIRLECIYAG
jgi:hypothetical protein